MRITDTPIACAAAVALILASGCGRETPEVNLPADGTAPVAGGTAPAADGTVRLADITGNPSKYFGQTVTVVADVEEVHSPLAFSLDEDAPMAGGIDNDLLVLSPKAGSLTNIDDQWLNNKVRVTGMIGKMTIVEVERELGWDLDRELEVEVESAEAILIATSIARTQ